MRAAIAALTARVEQLEAAARAGTSPLRPAAKPRRLPPRDARAVESRLGGYWASRLGIVSLVTGLAFFVAHGFDRMGPFLRAATGYAIGIALAAFGRWVMRRYQALGRILVAGGLGVAYYTTYAIHHVPAVRLIESPELAFVLLAGSVLAIIVVAQRMRSETVAGLALFLGLHTGMVSEVGVFTLGSGCLLAAGAAFFMARNRWVIVPLSTLVAVYSTLVTWLLGNPLVSAAGIVHPPGHLATSLGFIALYYATFSVAVALTPAALPRAAGAAFGMLNWAGAALVSFYEITHHRAGGLDLVFAALAATSLALAGVTFWRLGRHALVFHVHLALAAISIALSAWSALGGAWLILSLCALGAAAAALARPLQSGPLRAASAAILAVAFADHLATGPGRVLVGLAVAAAVVVHERLAPAGDRVGRIAAACGLAAVALAAAATTVPSSLVTATWIGAAAAIFLLGLGLDAIHYRLVALGVCALAFARLFFHDLAALSAGYRIASFLIAGAILLGVSFIYMRGHGHGHDRGRDRDPDPDRDRDHDHDPDRDPDRDGEASPDPGAPA
ncbi:MAG TPA: DUF2339 domain-containing protein [Kofleriaceae bacterium]|nr:DUF2339 domain-containing protein [Kofleriaceae bacterium]